MAWNVITHPGSSDIDWFYKNCSNENILPNFSDESEIICNLSYISDTDHPITPLASDVPSGMEYTAAWNIQSLPAKLGYVKILLANFEREAGIIGFSETFLNYTFKMEDINLGSGYVLKTRKDRTGDSHGGVAIYKNDSVPCEERKDLKHKDIEALWIEVT